MEGGRWIIPPPGEGEEVVAPPAPSEGRPSGRRRRVWIWVAVAFGVLFLLGLVIGPSLAALYLLRREAPALGPMVGLVEISGPIMAGGGVGPFGGFAGARAVVEQIRRAAKDKGIRAVVLRINSPGGTAAGAQEIYREVMRLRERKPVVASLGDVATSGAYYIASAADVIVASPGTITGSIWVVVELTDISGLMEKLGVRTLTVKSGKFKDLGSFYRPPTPEERRLLRSLVMDVYEQFVRDVARGRGMPVERVRAIADGRIFTGRMAKSYGLVDELGSLEDAVRVAARRAGIKGRPRVVRMAPRATLLDLLFPSEEWGYSAGALLSYLCTPVKLLPPKLAR